MIKSFFLSLGCFNNKAIRAVFFKTLGLTCAIFVALAFALYFSSASIPTLWGFDIASYSYLVSGIITSVLIMFLFRIVAVLILWMFADDIVEAIEWQYYSHEAVSAAKPSNMVSLMVGLKALIRAILYNILAIPFYIIGFFTIIGTPILFMAINGLLLGKELEEMVALRHSGHITLPGQEPKYQLGKVERFILGVAMNAAMLIPFVNLVIPVIAASMTTHMVHRKGL